MRFILFFIHRGPCITNLRMKKTWQLLYMEIVTTRCIGSPYVCDQFFSASYTCVQTAYIGVYCAGFLWSCDDDMTYGNGEIRDLGLANDFICIFFKALCFIREMLHLKVKLPLLFWPKNIRKIEIITANACSIHGKCILKNLNWSIYLKAVLWFLNYYRFVRFVHYVTHT